MNRGAGLGVLVATVWVLAACASGDDTDAAECLIGDSDTWGADSVCALSRSLEPGLDAYFLGVYDVPAELTWADAQDRPDAAVGCDTTLDHGATSYCGGTRVVYLDTSALASLAEASQSTVGVGWTMAHEYAHYVSDVNVYADPASDRLAEEWRADCRAGLYVREAADATGESYLWTSDEVSAFVGQVKVGRFDGTEDFFDTDVSGSGADRAIAFNTGYLTSDATFCDAYTSSADLDLAVGEAFSVRLPPGFSASGDWFDGDGLLNLYADDYARIPESGLVNRATERRATQVDVKSGYIDIFDDLFGSAFDTFGTVQTRDDWSDWFGDATVVQMKYQTGFGENDVYGILSVVSYGPGVVLILETIEPDDEPTDTEWEAIADYHNVLLLGASRLRQ
ncbi:hypothetical protein [Demequina rhizosphaerae]|uniref:hypothetical protein n=1 Tax=Demequina rhizosphaerae TaxID=1638985 RepID=UPI000A9AE6C3|nr:hypothetical protein [Demequina rhizosphaerae]